MIQLPSRTETEPKQKQENPHKSLKRAENNLLILNNQQMIQIPSRTETELKLNLLKTNKQKETNPPECIKKTKK